MWPIEVKTAFHIKLGSRDCLLMIGGRGNIYKKILCSNQKIWESIVL